MCGEQCDKTESQISDTLQPKLLWSKSTRVNTFITSMYKMRMWKGREENRFITFGFMELYSEFQLIV